MHPIDPTGWNRQHPVGTLVCVRTRNGDVVRLRTRTQAYYWGGLLLVDLDGVGGPYTVDALEPDALPPPPVP